MFHIYKITTFSNVHDADGVRWDSVGPIEAIVEDPTTQ